MISDLVCLFWKENETKTHMSLRSGIGICFVFPFSASSACVAWGPLIKGALNEVKWEISFPLLRATNDLSAECWKTGQRVQISF